MNKKIVIFSVIFIISSLVQTIVFAQDNDVLLFAISSEDTHKVRLALKAGIDPNAILENEYEETIFLSILNRITNKDVIELLLNRGVNVNAKSKYGWTALHYAASEGDEELVSMLLKHGADVNAEVQYWKTPPWPASYNNYRKMAAMLIKYGPDVAVDTKPGRTPLWFAAYNGYAEIVTLLLDNGAQVNTDIVMGAIKNGYYDIVSLLMKR